MSQHTSWNVRIQVSDDGETVSVHVPTDLLRRQNPLTSITTALIQQEPTDGVIPPMQRVSFNLDVASLLTGISYHKLIDYIADGQLTSTKNGRVHLIKPDDFMAFIYALPTSS